MKSHHLLIFSQSANASPQIKREVERAVNKGIYIIPFRVEDIPPAKALEYFSSTSQRDGRLLAVSGDGTHIQLECSDSLFGSFAGAANRE
jgi:hypothetical protein